MIDGKMGSSMSIGSAISPMSYDRDTSTRKASASAVYESDDDDCTSSSEDNIS